MARLADLLTTPETITSLEPEELALVVLNEVIAQFGQGNNGKANRYNFSLSYRNLPRPAQEAIMEAWAWLETSGCLAQSPQDQDGWFFVTRRGHELSNSSDTGVYTRNSVLPNKLLHPRIDQRVRSAFLRGEYDSAVFEAFKQLEVAIREASALSDTDIGVALARKAFHVESGALTNSAVVPAERQALSDLVAGAVGSYKNPHSHRNVTIKDAAEAAEIIILASHLLRIVESRKPA